jgi:hypothetical protein
MGRMMYDVKFVARTKKKFFSYYLYVAKSTTHNGHRASKDSDAKKIANSNPGGKHALRTREAVGREEW